MTDHAPVHSATPDRPEAAAAAPFPPGPQKLVERLSEGRPTNFPSVGVWLKTGMLRNWRGLFTSLVAAWFYLPTAFASSAGFAIALAAVGSVSGALGTNETANLPGFLKDVPFVGDVLSNMAVQSGGVVPALFGFFTGVRHDGLGDRAEKDDVGRLLRIA